MTPEPLVFRWGIISTGAIAAKFTKDLLVDPKTRNVHDVIHKVAAVGSRTIAKAQEFIDTEAGGDKAIKAYGSYDEVLADKDVDAVYIGTPHTYHYENTLAALRAKKNVLVEKPATSNAAELRALIQVAKENDVFIMEAMWTRFLPVSLEFKKIAEEGTLGRPVVLRADLSGNFGIENLPLSHRILDPRLGGGALLDVGPYPFVWAIMALYEHPSNGSSRPTSISGSMLKTASTGVDSNTSFTVNFPQSQAVLTCSININSATTPCTIRYERGEIIIEGPIYKPDKFTVSYFEKELEGGGAKVAREVTKIFKIVGGGWHFQADEVARCVRDGKKQSDSWTLEKSLLEMEVFDEVRRQGGYVLPPGVEKVV